MSDITLGMTVYRNPGNSEKTLRQATPIEFEVVGFGVALSNAGNQLPKVIVRVKKGAGALKDGAYFATFAVDAERLSKEPVHT